MTHVVKLSRFAQHLFTFFLHFAHGSFVMIGVIVMALAGFQLAQFGVDGLNPRALFGYRQHAQASVDVAMLDAAHDEAEAEGIPGLSAAYARITSAIAKRHRVSPAVVESLVRLAQREGQARGIDPLLILAVITVESGFNPFSESVMGAQGLMQIIPRFHADKISSEKGETALFDPAENIRVGTLILREYIRAAGSLDLALQQYGGALADAEMTYSNRVLLELERLRALSNPSVTRTAARVAADKAS